MSKEYFMSPRVCVKMKLCMIKNSFECDCNETFFIIVNLWGFV